VGFWRHDGGGDLHVIILFLHQFLATLSALGCVGKLGITPLRRMFHLVNVASIHLTIQLRVFEKNDGGGDLHVIILFLHQLVAILSVLGCVRRLGITPLRRMFHPVNVASIHLTIQLRVFEKNDGGGDLHVIILFLHQFWAILSVLGWVVKL